MKRPAASSCGKGLCQSFPLCVHCCQAGERKRPRTTLANGDLSCNGLSAVNQHKPVDKIFFKLLQTHEASDAGDCGIAHIQNADAIPEVDYAALGGSAGVFPGDAACSSDLQMLTGVPACLFTFPNGLAVVALARLAMKVGGREGFPVCCFTGSCRGPFGLKRMVGVSAGELALAEHSWVTMRQLISAF